jgi:hypothetical protein
MSMVGDTLELLKELQQAILNDPEIIRGQAKVLKRMFDELQKAGFTAEQAIKIVAAQGTGMKAG